MSASQISTISQNTLTCVSSTRKRKRDCESTRCTLALSFKMDLVDVNEIFKQLAFARYAQGPFSEFGDWTDQNLWLKLLQVLNERHSLNQDLKSVTRVVSHYANKYAEDSNVNWLKDEALKTNVISVFSSKSLMDKRGQLSVGLLKIIQEDQGSNEQVAESCGERSSVTRSRLRSRRSGSSSDVVKKLSSRLTYLRQNGYMSIEKMLDCFEYFFEGCDEKKMVKIQTWLGLRLTDQVEFLLEVPPRHR